MYTRTYVLSQALNHSVLWPSVFEHNRQQKVKVCLLLWQELGEAGEHRGAGENTRPCANMGPSNHSKDMVPRAESFPPSPAVHLLIPSQDYEPWARKEREFSAKDPPTSIRRGFFSDPEPTWEVITVAETLRVA